MILASSPARAAASASTRAIILSALFMSIYLDLQGTRVKGPKQIIYTLCRRCNYPNLAHNGIEDVLVEVTQFAR